MKHFSWKVSVNNKFSLYDSISIILLFFFLSLLLLLLLKKVDNAGLGESYFHPLYSPKTPALPTHRKKEMKAEV